MALKFLNDGYFASKVGIGIQSPAAKLHVNPTTTDEIAIAINGTQNYSAGEFQRIAAGDASSINRLSIGFGYDNPTDWAIRYSSYGRHEFYTGNDWGNAANTEKMVITSSGNVGIGTNSPGYKLNVINNNTATWTARFTNNTNNVYLSVNDANNYGIYVSGEAKNYFSGNVGIGTTSPNCNLQVSRNTSTANLFNFLDVVANFGNENPNPGNHYASGIRIYQGNGTMGSGLAALNIGVDTNSAVAQSQNTATIETPNGMTQGLRLSTRDSSAPIRFNTDSTERMRITSAGGISFGSSGTAYGTSGQVLTSNGNATPTWQAAGGSAWPQEKFAEYTIDSTTSNILVATLNSTTWHGNYLAGCLKFTFSTSDYIQVTYLPVSTFLSAGNKLFFKGTEMTTKNNGSNPATITITFAGNNGSYGSTCTVKLNRNQSISTYTKVNVLIQAISNPNMFILN